LDRSFDAMNASRLALLSLFLIVLVSGCGLETQATFEPDGTTVLLAKDKGCPGSGHPSCHPDEPDSGGQGTFRMTFSGPNISGVIGPFTESISGGTTILHGNQGTTVDGTDDPITFSAALISAISGGSACFANNPFVGPVNAVQRKKDGLQGSQFFFTAIGTDGSEQDYELKMRGVFDGGPWPPEVGGSNLITGHWLAMITKANKPKCKVDLEGVALYTLLVERLD